MSSLRQQLTFIFFSYSTHPNVGSMGKKPDHHYNPRRMGYDKYSPGACLDGTLHVCSWM